MTVSDQFLETVESGDDNSRRLALTRQLEWQEILLRIDGVGRVIFGEWKGCGLFTGGAT